MMLAKIYLVVPELFLSESLHFSTYCVYAPLATIPSGVIRATNYVLNLREAQCCLLLGSSLLLRRTRRQAC